MTDQTVYVALSSTVGPVAPCLVNNAMRAGTLIVNTDTSNSVWLSSSPSMASGTGVRLGPAGSTSVTEDGPLYAVTDSSATAGVLLSLTTSLTGVDNPVDVGVAVATQLLGTGVPSVFNNQVVGLFNALIGGTIQPGTSVTVDIYKYGTLTFRVSSIPVAPVSLDMEVHEAPIGGTFDSVIAVENFAVIDPAVPGLFAIPVYGQSAKFTNRGTQPIQLNIYGNNRVLSSLQPINLGGQNLSRVMQTAATPNPGVGAGMLFTHNDSGPDSTSYNGSFKARVFVNSTTPTVKPVFVLQMMAYDPSAVRNISVMDSASFHANDSANGWEWYGDLNHPVGVVQWRLAIQKAYAGSLTGFMEMVRG